jgi:hypothetical protein
MNKPLKLVWLEASSFAGVAAGATHWFGTLVGIRRRKVTRVRLERRLTKAQAAKLNERDNGTTYRGGSKTQRFDTNLAMIRAARRVWREHFPDADVLVYGNHAVVSPLPVLAGEPSIVRALNQIVCRWDKEELACRYMPYAEGCAYSAEHLYPLEREWDALIGAPSHDRVS